jgi:uncharacterized protein YbdZ (MbtH family)
MRNDEQDNQNYKVVVNHEEQYSIWLEHKVPPRGWKEVGKSGPKAECLAYIKEVWTDLRPLSLRQKMAAAAQNPPEPEPEPNRDKPPEEDLVTRLCREDQSVEVRTFPEKSPLALKESIDRNYVHIRFPNTKGGTELGIRIDPQELNQDNADFEKPEGVVKLVGNLTLDYVKLRCSSEIDLKTLTGTARLARV